jgi:hypothetical protein
MRCRAQSKNENFSPLPQEASPAPPVIFRLGTMRVGRTTRRMKILIPSALCRLPSALYQFDLRTATDGELRELGKLLEAGGVICRRHLAN